MQHILRGVNALRSTSEGQAKVEDGKYVSLIVTATELMNIPGDAPENVRVTVSCEHIEINAVMGKGSRVQMNFPGLTPERRANRLCKLLNGICVELTMQVDTTDPNKLIGHSCVVTAPFEHASGLLESQDYSWK